MDENYQVKRKAIANKLSKNSNLYNFAKKTHDLYNRITGCFHVLPDFLIIGAGRAGTTSLYEGINNHPYVSRCSISAVQFFDSKFNDNPVSSRHVGWYRNHFPLISTKYYKKLLDHGFSTGESSHYMHHPHAPKRVKKIIPNVKLIVILRNPIDRAYSHYRLEVTNSRETLSFEDALEQEDKRVEEEMNKMIKNENYYSPQYYYWSYLSQSRYAEDLKHWLEIFPSNQFLFLNSEDFYRDPPKIFNEVFDFLNLPKYQGKFDYYNLTKPSKMDPATRKKLLDYFKPYNEDLFKLIGRRFDWEK